MGSGTGIASGFGKLGRFGMDQPVLSVCGDSTFFHAVMPALVNAIHNKADMTLVVLDNSGTAMTGFQPHPGLVEDAAGNQVPALDIAKIVAAMGAHVERVRPLRCRGDAGQSAGAASERRGERAHPQAELCAVPRKEGQKNVPGRPGRIGLFRRELRLQQAVHPRVQVPRAPVGPGDQNRPHRRGDLLGVRRVRIHLPFRGHHEKGGGITWQPKHLQQIRTT